jgi:hypothetical protein
LLDDAFLVETFSSFFSSKSSQLNPTTSSAILTKESQYVNSKQKCFYAAANEHDVALIFSKKFTAFGL